MPPPHLTSFSNFLKYMEAQGLTELKNFDEASYYPNLWQKRFPGTVPSDFDAEMKQDVLSLIEDFGYEKGTERFVKDSRNAFWLAARFNILKHDGNSRVNWRDQVLADNFGVRTDVGNLQPDSIPPDFQSPSAPVDTQIEQEVPPSNNVPLHPPGSIEASASDVAKRGLPQDIESDVGSPAIEHFISDVTEITTADTLKTALSERFSPQRLNTAMQTLTQYGAKEGLRRLKDSDPEIATQMQRLIYPPTETD